jgi:sigma-B regulation protein RsbU (phosphoserine phosphatase)
VIATQLLGVCGLWSPGVPVTRELRMVRWAFGILMLFVLNENASNFGLPSLDEVEWVGFTFFIAGLGYATALRVVDGERRLLAIAQELETARRIQASILPRELPRLPQVSLAVRYQPMQAVAGDFYDVLLRDSGLGLLVADVSGHGVPAALVASMVKVAFATQAPHAQHPGLVLAGVNRALCDSLDGAYVTAGYAWLELASGALRYASAGHPPLLLRGANGVERLEESGLLMGFAPDVEYPVMQRRLARGDRLLFYTDGAIEATSPRDELFELDRLSELLEGSRDAAQGLADQVLASLAAWRGGAGATDDLTLLVVDYQGAGMIASIDEAGS